MSMPAAQAGGGSDPMPLQSLLPHVELFAVLLLVSLGAMLLSLVLLRSNRRRQHETQLSESNYRKLFNSSNEAIFIHDLDSYTILEVNQRFTELYGWPAQKIPQLSIADLSSNQAPYDAQHAEAWMQRAKNEGAQLFEWHAKHADGHLFWVEVSLRPEQFNGSLRLLASVRDITERKRANAIEYQMRQTLHNLPIALFAIDERHVVIHWNALLSDMTGVAADSVLGTTEAWRGFYASPRPCLANLILNGADVKSMGEQYHENIYPSKRVRHAVEAEAFFRNIGENGMWLHFMAVPLRDEDGRVIGALETLTDITERKLAEIALFESEATYRTLIEHAPEAILVLDADQDGRFVEANRHAEQLLGYRQSELLQKNPMSTSPPIQPDGRSTREAAFAYINDALNGKDVRYEWLCRHASGKDIPCEIHLVQLPSQKNLHLVRCSIFDITERKATQAAILNERNFLQALLEAMPIPIFYKNRAGLYLGCNQAFLNMMHLERENIIGKTLHDWLPAEMAEGYQKKDHALYTGDGRQVFERVINEHLGEPRHVIFHRAIYRNQDGAVGGMIGAILDITELQVARIALEQLNQVLETRVLERTSELQTAMKHLVQSEKLAALGSLVAGIAHELNTPIGNIVTVASTLRDETVAFENKLTSGELRRSEALRAAGLMRQAGEMIENNAVRSAQLISDFKQVAVDQSSARRRPFDLRATLEEVMSTLLPMLKHTSHSIEIRIPDAIKMDSYPGPIEQIVTNLITNSLIHGFEHREQGSILIRAERQDDSVMLEYSDNGKGMDDTTLAHLFDPFYTTKLGQGGSGLGMYIVYNLVTSVLGGSITVHSHPGQGSLFRLSMPLVAP